MSLNRSLNSIEALYRKLEREAYRAYHEKDQIHKMDHFYNFCVTAQSLRDYFFERKKLLSQQQQQPYNDAWNQNRFLVAVSEIANTAKHFTLRNVRTRSPKAVKTKRVRGSKGKFVNIYINQAGELSTKHVEAPDCKITLESGAQYGLYSFTNEVLEYWRHFLKSQSISIRRQPLKRLIGSGT